MKDNNLKPVQHLLTKFTEPVSETGNIKSEVGQERNVVGGRAYNFSGKELIRDFAGASLTTTKTFSFWFKTIQTSTGHFFSGASASAVREFRIVSGKINAVSKSIQATGTTNYNDGKWHFLYGEITRNANVNIIIKVEVDGNTEIDRTILWSEYGADVPTGNAISFIGSWETVGVDFYVGQLYDFRIWNSSLTTIEKDTVKNFGVVSRTLENHFKCEEGAGLVAFDCSLNKNGTINLGAGTEASFHYKGGDVPFSYADSEGYNDSIKAGQLPDYTTPSTSHPTDITITKYGDYFTAERITTNSNLGFHINTNKVFKAGHSYKLTYFVTSPARIFHRHKTFNNYYKAVVGGVNMSVVDGDTVIIANVGGVARSKAEVWFTALQDNSSIPWTINGDTNLGIITIEDIIIESVGVTIPAKNETHDVLGKPLLYKGQAKLNAQLKQSAMLDFNTGASVDFGDVPALNLKEIIISFWWRVESWTRTVFSIQGDQPKQTTPTAGYWLSLSSGGIGFKGSTDATFYSRHPFANKELLHMTLVYYRSPDDTLKGVSKIFVNGVETATHQGTNINVDNIVFGTQTRFNQTSYNGALYNFQVTPYSQDNLTYILANKNSIKPVFSVPCSEGKGRFITELVGGKHGVVVPNGAAENTWWNIQNDFHYNEINGYLSLIGDFKEVTIPFTTDADGYKNFSLKGKIYVNNVSTTARFITNRHISNTDSVDFAYDHTGKDYQIYTNGAGSDTSLTGIVPKVGDIIDYEIVYSGASKTIKISVNGGAWFENRVKTVVNIANAYNKFLINGGFNSTRSQSYITEDNNKFGSHDVFVPAKYFNKLVLFNGITHLGTRYTNKLSSLAKIDLNPNNTPLLPNASAVNSVAGVLEGHYNKDNSNIISVGKVESKCATFTGHQFISFTNVPFWYASHTLISKFNFETLVRIEGTNTAKTYNNFLYLDTTTSTGNTPFIFAILASNRQLVLKRFGSDIESTTITYSYIMPLNQWVSIKIVDNTVYVDGIEIGKCNIVGTKDIGTHGNTIIGSNQTHAQHAGFVGKIAYVKGYKETGSLIRQFNYALDSSIPTELVSGVTGTFGNTSEGSALPFASWGTQKHFHYSKVWGVKADGTPCKPLTFDGAVNLTEVATVGRQILAANNITNSNLY